MPARPTRLLALRVIAKILALAGFGALMYMFAGSILPSRPAGRTSLAINISDLPVDQLRELQWGSRRIVAMRRTPEMISALRQTNDALVDPRSDSSRQPEEARNPFRSLDPGVFIALNYDPEFGCPIEFAGPALPAPVIPWHGGFRDVCRGSWYDLAGRVYKGQPSGRNLMVPPHTIEGSRIIVKE